MKKKFPDHPFFSRNIFVFCSNRFTCSNNSVLTAADSSLLAEFVCTTDEICPIPIDTWDRASAS